MKIFLNIILTAMAIVLAVSILSTISKTQVDNIKYAFNVEQVQKGDNYKLIPKKYGLDTCYVFNIQKIQEIPVEGRFGICYYKVFISNNEILHMFKTDEYELIKN